MRLLLTAKGDSRLNLWQIGRASCWTSTAKNLDDVNEVDDDGNARLDADGNQLVTKGLKSQWIAKTKEAANSLLAPTDWQVIAKAERDRVIDSDVATYRAAVISKCASIETAITNAADLDAFKALFNPPVDDDGVPTGNAPIYDWPE
jgi:hypothetical protein